MANVFLRPPPLTNQEIIKEAEALTHEYVETIGLEKAKLGISFDVAYEQVIYPKYGIELIDGVDLGVDDSGKKILGEFDAFENKAFIDVSLLPSGNDRRRAFTCWHEIAGHGILHGQWLRDQYGDQLERMTTTADTIDMHPENQFEWQANLFAAHASAPTWCVNYAIRTMFNPLQPFRYIGPRTYSFCLPSQTRFHTANSYQDVCYRIAQYIRPYFGNLSIEALSYRVAESGWVVDQSGVEDIPSTRPRLRRLAPVA